MRVTNKPVILPITRPVFPRVSSNESGFFLFGIMDEPVVTLSLRSKKPYCSDENKMKSSASRDNVIDKIDILESVSSKKSLDKTPSIELHEILLKFKSLRRFSRFRGYAEPANAALPSGIVEILSKEFEKRSTSRDIEKKNDIM